MVIFHHDKVNNMHLSQAINVLHSMKVLLQLISISTHVLILDTKQTTIAIKNIHFYREIKESSCTGNGQQMCPTP